jgi:hypothetical protein
MGFSKDEQRMKSYKSAAAVLVVIAAMGFTGCNGRDRGHERDRDRVDEHRDPHWDNRPCDHVRDPHCDDRPR